MRDNFEINEDAVKDKIELSPIEKYIKFNKFPWKLVIHIALLVFTTIQAVSMVQLAASYQKPMLQVFKYVLLNSTNQDFSQTFYTLSDFQSHLQGLSFTLSNLDNYMLNKVQKDTANYSLQVYYSNPTLSAGNLNQLSYTYAIPDISQGIMEPFNSSNITSLKSFVQTIESMNFNIENLLTSSQLVESQVLCYNWTISLQYQFVAMSHIAAVLEAQPTYCNFGTNGSLSQQQIIEPDEIPYKSHKPSFSQARFLSSAKTYSPFGNNLIMLHVAVFSLALASMIFAWFYFYEMGLLYMSTRHAKHMQQVNYFNEMEEQRRENQYSSSWEDLSFLEKVKFFDVFFVVMMAGNVFQILGSIISIYQVFIPEESATVISIKEAFVGLGCMCCWFNIIKYLSYNTEFKATTDILSRSATGFLKFLVGVIPLYMAFVFLGRCLFWKYSKFESTSQAIVALFSMMAGDIINETYTDTNAEGFFATIYLTCWIILFMSAVHNVFISIISEGFRNKFLEDRYQELFNLYALGDKEVVSKWGTQKDLMMPVPPQEEQKREDVLSLMPYIRRDSEIAFDPETREKIRKTEMERQKLKETILEKTDEVEKILSNMKDIVNEFCSGSKDREEKKVVKNSFLKCLKDLHLFIKSELAKDQSKEPGGISRFGLEAKLGSMTKVEEQDEKPSAGLRVDPGATVSFGQPGPQIK